MNEAWLIWLLTGLLFLAGLAGTILRRQLLAMLLSLELMTNAVNVALAYYGRLYRDSGALAVVFLLLGVAACEAVVALSLILALYRDRSVDETAGLRELNG